MGSRPQWYVPFVPSRNHESLVKLTRGSGAICPDHGGGKNAGQLYLVADSPEPSCQTLSWAHARGGGSRLGRLPRVKIGRQPDGRGLAAATGRASMPGTRIRRRARASTAPCRYRPATLAVLSSKNGGVDCMPPRPPSYIWPPTMVGLSRLSRRAERDMAKRERIRREGSRRCLKLENPRYGDGRENPLAPDSSLGARFRSSGGRLLLQGRRVKAWRQRLVRRENSNRRCMYAKFGL